MTAQRIRLLDETTINQIAAGEVIENPASVVKELVENALDSGASSISVETRGAGRSLIRVIDNGCGMSQDDLILALERHATSKLSEIEDLNSLSTLGFRGEALPSIASVSKLSIHSADHEEGHVLYAEGGCVRKVQIKPRRRGTTVEVKGLFFNVPVRKQFQKSVGIDRSEIHKVLTKMALCHPQVAFSWTSEDEKPFTLSADAPLDERIRILLGDSFAQALLPVEHHKGAFHLSGFTSLPALNRPNRTGHYLLINGRAVVSPFVSRKILEGYGTRLSAHRYPLFVLYLTLPPSIIDVNVHPQKKEVRFRHEEELGSFVIHAIEKTFGAKRKALSPVSMPTFLVSEPVISYASSLPTPKKEEEALSLFSIKPKILAHVGHYLLLEDPQGVRLVDGAAARFRIMYEQLMKPEKTKAIQHLLIPLQIEVMGTEKALLNESLHHFETIGVSMRHFGENTFIIDAIPACFEGEEAECFVQAFLDLGEVPREKKIVSALRKTLKGGLNGSGEALVDRLFKCAEPDLTPDGKPTHYLLTEKDMAKLFR